MDDQLILIDPTISFPARVSCAVISLKKKEMLRIKSANTHLFSPISHANIGEERRPQYRIRQSRKADACRSCDKPLRRIQRPASMFMRCILSFAATFFSHKGLMYYHRSQPFTLIREQRYTIRGSGWCMDFACTRSKMHRTLWSPNKNSGLQRLQFYFYRKPLPSFTG